jgi:serine protease
MAAAGNAASGETIPYGIGMVQADQVSSVNVGNRKVCIIDSGYYRDHEDLPFANVTKTDDAGTGDAFTDGSGHGTHVAGTIAALGGNGKGVVGVNPGGNLQLHIIKVFGDNGAWAYSSTLINALQQCRNASANVVNMSLGGDFSSKTESNAFAQAYSAGVLSVAAAGNGGTTRKSYPASYDSVISVAAIDSNKSLASFSQRNDAVELAAPGVAVLSTVPFKETNTLTAGGVVYSGTWIEFAARSNGVSGALVDGGLCTATSGAWSNAVVLCERGEVSFFDKVRNVQNSGGAAAVIYNNVSGGFAGTLGAGNTSTIPAIGLSREDGLAVKEGQLGSSVQVVSMSEKPGSGYEAWDGTSMATPHVAGVAALVWSHHSTKTNAEIRRALQLTAEDLGAAGRDTSFGFGLIRAKAALDYLAGSGSGGGGGSDTTPPVISNVKSAKVNNGGTFQITWTTNEPATSQVDFQTGTTGTLSSTTLVTNHSMQFKGTRGVQYTFLVRSTDAAGNTATSGPYTHQN